MPSKLDSILDALTSVESRLIPVFIHNPTSQKIAALAFVGEQYAIGLFKSLQVATPASTSAQTAVEPSTRIG